MKQLTKTAALAVMGFLVALPLSSQAMAHGHSGIYFSGGVYGAPAYYPYPPYYPAYPYYAYAPPGYGYAAPPPPPPGYPPAYYAAPAPVAPVVGGIGVRIH